MLCRRRQCLWAQFCPKSRCFRLHFRVRSRTSSSGITFLLKRKEERTSERKEKNAEKVCRWKTVFRTRLMLNLIYHLSYRRFCCSASFTSHHFRQSIILITSVLHSHSRRRTKQLRFVSLQKCNKKNSQKSKCEFRMKIEYEINVSALIKPIWSNRMTFENLFLSHFCSHANKNTNKFFW